MKYVVLFFFVFLSSTACVDQDHVEQLDTRFRPDTVVVTDVMKSDATPEARELLGVRCSVAVVVEFWGQPNKPALIRYHMGAGEFVRDPTGDALSLTVQPQQYASHCECFLGSTSLGNAHVLNPGPGSGCQM